MFKKIGVVIAHLGIVHDLSQLRLNGLHNIFQKKLFHIKTILVRQAANVDALTYVGPHHKVTVVIEFFGRLK